MTSEPLLRLQGVMKRYGDFTALHNIDLDIQEGEFFTIVGPSGSGKSTMIRLIVGMDEVTDGSIWLRGKRIDETPANLRPTCMVFQSLALFPHMSVGQNIEFPLKLRKIAHNQRRARALELLELLRLPPNCYAKRISQCSGGEQQRVALARALAFDPEILLFDEPLSSLDYRLRKTLEKELKDLHHRTGKTFVYITHSLEEAMVMSDRIAIMHNGRFEQIAVADEIYSRPVSRFVAEFMGEVNLFDVEYRDSVLTSSDLTIRPNNAAKADPADGKGQLMVRPEDVRFGKDTNDFDYVLFGQLMDEYILGSRIQYEVRTAAGKLVTVEKPREDRTQYEIGSEVILGFKATNTHFIPAD
ncbi:MAG: ABC transporter ATP-binding protein [Aestuariivita sp.]|nr:ABC transporter ATP-binding protein [Aestuariivita sp.]MCY4202313.1 ABC transporter ATP-binding protein [Aestuariivita sp.]MCY4289922.1 ABC transporter ATP-binding protein [Aestuariivita sp.]MCY4346757.1 ABC transporter ATP-binding protein [Aestuariivita sp.]